MTAQKLSGAYYTPPDVVEALACWVLRDTSDRLLDPSCGDGRFLATHSNSVGIEQDTVAAHAAISRAPGALVHEGDFFEWASATKERFEACAGNPPFIRYQNFKGTLRKQALDLCARHGANFSGLTSSWAPFIVGACCLLKPGGRAAFVVPAEIGHAPYAVPLMEFLVRHFARVQIVAVRRKLFPELSEDCWLLYAEEFGESTSEIRFSASERFEWSPRPPKNYVSVGVQEWKTLWNKRLRPFLLPTSTRDLYLEMGDRATSRRLGEFAKIGIGYVSGANDFFHLRPSEADALQIPDRFLTPTVRSGRGLPRSALTKRTLEQWRAQDKEILLLNVPPEVQIPATVRSYLDSPKGKKVRTGYKCRNRRSWYSVPDVRFPEYILTYMSGRSPALIRNSARATCSNAVHGLMVQKPTMARACLSAWGTPVSQLSCELEGHPLGGGMLKLEVREAERILLPSKDEHISRKEIAEIREAIEELQGWRHYAKQAR